MYSKSAALLCALALAGTGAQAERVECSVTADNWVQSPPWIPRPGQSANHGSDPQLTMTGRNSWVLLAFDMGPAKGLHIEKATLRLYRRADPVPLTVVGISTLS